MSPDPRSEYSRVSAELMASAPVTSGKMFGVPCLKNEVGKAFAVFHEGAMVFKLAAPAHAEALSLPGSRLFDPSGRGRPMKEWVQVPGEHATRWSDLAREALRYSESTREGGSE